ncbi:LA_1612 family putative O-antigen biosynthesis protein [Leptospira alstonii]|nr:LA_1612 family putative O-antigen biosynthesis protein [Leptospira alstonii]EQA80306.1 hypothetical protein LEP1GSC193_4310 [Leptospira alstonii serovar Pingchang str. 80-412]
MKAIFRRLLFVWNARKVWAKPKRAHVLIFDRNGSNNFFYYFNERLISVLDIRGESFNFYILLKCILTLKISVKFYYAYYISAVQPKVVVTFIDNNWQFYSFKSRFPDIQTVLVQNGWRGNLDEQFGREDMKGYLVDYMFLFNKNIGSIYSKYLKGITFGSGSFLNNYHLISPKSKKRTILFISQYRPKNNSPIFSFVDERPISYDEFYLAEDFLLNKLSTYCVRNGFRFAIKPSNSKDIEEQYAFFKRKIGHENFDFLERDQYTSAYSLIDQSQIVVGIDSTLVYESIARGHRTAFFTLRSVFDRSRRFAWPADYPESGPFWTNKMDEFEFKRMMDYITQATDSEWETTRLKYIKDLMEYDPGNSQFIALMQELNVPLKENI